MGGDASFGGKGMGKVGEVDEGWLKDRHGLRAKAHFTMLMMFPRSPTPVRERETEAAGVAPPVQMTPEEEARAKKFQEGIKKAVKEDAKDSKKKEKKKDKE